MKLTQSQFDAKLLETFARYRMLKGAALTKHEEWRKAQNAADAARNEIEALAMVEVNGE